MQTYRQLILVLSNKSKHKEKVISQREVLFLSVTDIQACKVSAVLFHWCKPGLFQSCFMLFLNHQQFLTSLHLIQSSTSWMSASFEPPSTPLVEGCNRNTLETTISQETFLLHYITLFFSTVRAHTAQRYSRLEFTDLWEERADYVMFDCKACWRKKQINRFWLKDLHKSNVF